MVPFAVLAWWVVVTPFLAGLSIAIGGSAIYRTSTAAATSRPDGANQ